MANTKAAKKYAKASGVRATRNRSVKSAVKTYVAKARRAMTDGSEEATAAVTTATSVLDRAASKGILHPNNAARRKSRLMKRLVASAAPGAAAPEVPKRSASKAAPKKGSAAPATGKGAAKKTSATKAAGAKPAAAKPSTAKASTEKASSTRK